MSIDVRCPNCGATQPALEERAGGDVECRVCRRAIPVSAAALAPFQIPVRRDDKLNVIFWCLLALLTTVFPWGVVDDALLWSKDALDLLPRPIATYVIAAWIAAGVLLLMAVVLRRLLFSIAHTLLPLVPLVVLVCSLGSGAPGDDGDAAPSLAALVDLSLPAASSAGRPLVLSAGPVMGLLAALSVLPLYVTVYLRLRRGYSAPLAIVQGIAAGLCLLFTLLTLVPGSSGFLDLARHASLKDVLATPLGGTFGLALLALGFVALAAGLAGLHAAGVSRRSWGLTSASHQFIVLTLALLLTSAIALPALYLRSGAAALTAGVAVILIAALPVLLVTGIARLLADILDAVRPLGTPAVAATAPRPQPGGQPRPATVKCPPRPRPNARLLLLDGGDIRAVPLPTDRPITVGRASSNTIPLGDPSVSGEHILLECRGDAWWVKDLGSSNGTLVNGHPVTALRLEDGDVLELGDQKMRLMLTD